MDRIGSVSNLHHLSVHSIVKLLLILVFVLMGLVRTYPVQAATFNPGCSGGVGNAGQLQADIATAGGNGQADTVNLVGGCTYTLTTTITVNADGGNLLTIVGNGAVISGNNSRRIFVINSGANLTLNNVTITQGYNPDVNAARGGAIYNDGGTLTVNNSTFFNNSVVNAGPNGSAGGAIYSLFGTVHVSNSTFSNNSTGGSNAGFTGGGAIYQYDGTLTVANSTFNGNAAPNNFGGAITNFSSATATITNSTFSDNSSSGGGAIFNGGSAVTVTNSTFFENSAFSGGALVNSSSGTMTVINSTLSGNNASNIGGGILNSSTLTLRNNIITNSTAGGDCAMFVGTLTVGENLIEDGSCSATLSGDPSLDPAGLQNNGGSTRTIRLLLGSKAINAGVNSALPGGTTTDQRGGGFARIVDSTVDLGAFEVSDTVSLTATDTTALCTFTDAGQLVAFAGLNPRQHQSGETVQKKTGISKMGSASLRAALYMPAITAMKHNPVIRVFADRLRSRGVRGKALIVAAMRKLLHIVVGVLKSGKPFNPSFAVRIG
jgi:hypothetical protein